VREVVVPSRCVMVRYVFWVRRNLMSVIVMGTRTPMEMRKLRMRDMRRKRRMSALRCWGCQFQMWWVEEVGILRLLVASA
jgi:hypothetical protein